MYGNQFGFVCPECDSDENITIQAVQYVEAQLLPDGTTDNGGDIEWEDDSHASCGCGWHGEVKDLIVRPEWKSDNFAAPFHSDPE